MSSPEQRRSDRIPVEIEVHVTPSSDHNFYTGFTQNISEGGLFIATNHVLPIGTELSFEFRVDKEPGTISAEGVVCWVREHESLRSGDVHTGMGVRFNTLDEETQKRVNRFIERRRESLFFDPD
jgi:uncharacterized protein (TIGR02266 family)